MFVMSYRHVIHITAGTIQMSQSVATDHVQLLIYIDRRMTPDTSTFSAFVMDTFSIPLREQSKCRRVVLLTINSYRFTKAIV